jgi:CheY-like chemotaxis protein
MTLSGMARTVARASPSPHTHIPEINVGAARRRSRASPTRRPGLGFSLPRSHWAAEMIAPCQGPSSWSTTTRSSGVWPAGSSRPAGSRSWAKASSVAEAIEAAERLRPDAALVDVGLPDGDGIALAQRLVALPSSPRVVLTSSDPDAVTCDDLHRVGAVGFVAKDELPNAPLKELLGPG